MSQLTFVNAVKVLGKALSMYSVQFKYGLNVPSSPPLSLVEIVMVPYDVCHL